MLADASATTPTIGQYSLTIKDLSIVETLEPSVTILWPLAVGPAVLRFKPNFGVSAN
jgi:hypothetical protein